MTACIRCEQRPAVVCDDGRRALAFLDHASGFGTVARHPDHGTICRLCEHGDAELCVECLCQRVLDARRDPAGRYASPTPNEFKAQHQRALADIERVAAISRELGVEVLACFDDRAPADRGPSWRQQIGGAS